MVLPYIKSLDSFLQVLAVSDHTLVTVHPFSSISLRQEAGAAASKIPLLPLCSQISSWPVEQWDCLLPLVTEGVGEPGIPFII